MAHHCQHPIRAIIPTRRRRAAGQVQSIAPMKEIAYPQSGSGAT
jgi:hypothetical protein